MPQKHRQFASFIAARREALGLSMNQLAQQLSVPRSRIHYWESGQFLPKIAILERLARALKVSYEDLLIKGRYPRHEVGTTEYFRRLGYPEEAVAELERAIARVDRKFPKRQRGRRR
jgi:transcriptional regulator with XRE-family HTH domain